MNLRSLSYSEKLRLLQLLNAKLGTEPPSLVEFIEITSGFKLESWQQHLTERLAKLKDQTGQRLLVHGPPQFGKSIIVSQRYPAWVLGQDPGRRIRLACYNQTHATRFSKVNLEIMQTKEYEALFPDKGARLPPINAGDEWSTMKRLEFRDGQPSFAALGLGSGFTGLGGDDIIIDDPYKNREEAFSEATNSGIWGWWTDVVLPRLNPDSNVVVMFHRWKLDDFAGRLMEQGNWEVLRYSAICDSEEDPLGRQIGEQLSPRYSVEYLEQVREQQGSHSFSALYQGTPTLREGNMIKTHLIKEIGAEPSEAREYIGVDLGGSDSKKADSTSLTRIKVTPDNKVYICHNYAGQWSPKERNYKLRQYIEDHKQAETWIEKVPGLAVEVIDNLSRELLGLRVRFEMAAKDKVTRADPFAAAVEAGNVYIVKTGDPDQDKWIRSYLDELGAFPFWKHDDKVDSTTLAFNKACQRPELIGVF